MVILLMLARLFALILFLPSLAVAAGFLSVYEDLPLQPGLIEVPGSALSFDTPVGRIVEVEAKGSSDKQSVLRFYAAALPQLGWVQDAPSQFHREQEILKIETTESNKGLVVVRFKVSPK